MDFKIGDKVLVVYDRLSKEFGITMPMNTGTILDFKWNMVRIRFEDTHSEWVSINYIKRLNNDSKTA